MIKGQVIRKGTMTVGGEQLTGLFIECEREELTDNKLDLYTIVEVVPE